MTTEKQRGEIADTHGETGRRLKKVGSNSGDITDTAHSSEVLSKHNKTRVDRDSVMSQGELSIDDTSCVDDSREVVRHSVDLSHGESSAKEVIQNTSSIQLDSSVQSLDDSLLDGVSWDPTVNNGRTNAPFQFSSTERVPKPGASCIGRDAVEMCPENGQDRSGSRQVGTGSSTGWMRSISGSRMDSSTGETNSNDPATRDTEEGPGNGGSHVSNEGSCTRAQNLIQKDNTMAHERTESTNQDIQPEDKSDEESSTQKMRTHVSRFKYQKSGVMDDRDGRETVSNDVEGCGDGARQNKKHGTGIDETIPHLTTKRKRVCSAVRNVEKNTNEVPSGSTTNWTEVTRLRLDDVGTSDGNASGRARGERQVSQPTLKKLGKFSFVGSAAASSSAGQTDTTTSSMENNECSSRTTLNSRPRLAQTIPKSSASITTDISSTDTAPTALSQAAPNVDSNVSIVSRLVRKKLNDVSALKKTDPSSWTMVNPSSQGPAVVRSGLFSSGDGLDDEDLEWEEWGEKQGKKNRVT